MFESGSLSEIAEVIFGYAFKRVAIIRGKNKTNSDFKNTDPADE